jgi:hypothetical protein
MSAQLPLLFVLGILAGIGASFSGLGGGFLVVPLLLILVEHVSTGQFKRIFAVILVGLAAYLFFRR